MKKTIYSIMALAAITMASCGAEAEETKKEAEPAKVEEPKPEEVKVVAIAGTYMTTDSTTITWQGKHNKDEEFAHEGTMNVVGSVEVVDNAIVSGTFTLDVASLNEGDGEYQDKLENHLKDPTFFNTEVFPTATFSILSIEEGKVTGLLDLIGMSQEVVFDAEINITEESVTILGAVVVDLLAFNMPAFVASTQLPEEEAAEAVDASVIVELNLSLTK
jgi:polyisoprenoid-binding protein YceI